MTTIPPGLTAALADRYRLERELGAGGMARRRVAKATARLVSLKRPGFRFHGHFSDLLRVATERRLERSARPGARESFRADSAADSELRSDG
jgi:hypothetical protein